VDILNLGVLAEKRIVLVEEQHQASGFADVLGDFVRETPNFRNGSKADI